MVMSNLETERLSLRKPTMAEQYDLWNILRQEKVWQYYMNIPDRFNNDRKAFQESLDDWSKQEKFFKRKIDNAEEDSDKYTWSIFLKNGTVIGQMTVQPNDNYPDNPRIRTVGWFIDPKLQRQGYAYEAARAVLDYMFSQTDLKEIRTEANIVNPGSWGLMEKLGFIRIGESISSHYDINGNPLKQYNYMINRDMYLTKNKCKIK